MKTRIDDGDDDCTERKKTQCQMFFASIFDGVDGEFEMRFNFINLVQPSPLLTPKKCRPCMVKKKSFSSLRESFESQ